MELLNLTIHEHELVIYIIVACGVFLASKWVGTWIEEMVRRKVRATAHDCECPAMTMVKQDIPIIKRIQEERTKALSDLKTEICTNTTVINRLDKNIDTIFKLFEEEWKDEIRALKMRKVKEENA